MRKCEKERRGRPVSEAHGGVAPGPLVRRCKERTVSSINGGRETRRPHAEE